MPSRTIAVELLCKAEDVSALSRADIESALTRLVCDHVLPGAAGLNGSMSAVSSHAAATHGGEHGGGESNASTGASARIRPDSEAALQLLEDNRHELHKIFQIYARREPWLPLPAWLQFGADFELSRFLSKNALVCVALPCVHAATSLLIVCSALAKLVYLCDMK